MTDTSSHDLSELTRASAAVQHTAEAATSASTVTSAALLVNKSWGADAIGAAFAKVYVGGAQTVIASVMDIGPHLGDIATTLQSSAGQYAQTEDDNVQQASGADV
ncbi:MAG: hypothetical protein ACR2I1_06295 [Propionibacteriaceae bacterium]